MPVMSPPAHNNILLGTAPHCSLFWWDFPKKPSPKPIAKPAPKPAPKGKHLEGVPGTVRAQCKYLSC